MSGSSTDMLMPPKKCKAARKTLSGCGLSEADGVDELEQRSEGDMAVVTDGKLDNGRNEDSVDDIMDEGGDSDGKNIFKIDIVEGKRKRSVPRGEQLLQEWLKKNFIEQTDSQLSIQDMFTVYLEMCSANLSVAVELVKFVKILKEMFPSGIALVDNSPYSDSVRVPKKKRKNTSESEAKSKSKEDQAKVKDWIREAIVDLGNPRKGLRCSVIASNLMLKYPALRVSTDVKRIVKWILRELRFGHIECVRGIGACGLYRLPRTKEEELAEIADEERLKKEKQAKKEKEVKKDEGDSEKGDGTGGNDKDDDKGSDEEQKSKEVDEKGANNVEEEVDKSDKLKKKKKKKSRKASKKKRDKVVYGEPKRVEDTFALAMTYNSEPKEASSAKIRKYLQQYYYKDDLNIDKLKKCLENGCERGYWLQVSGQNTNSGTYQLNVESFDPSADDDLIGQVMNAIVACTEPKTSSSQLLKKYIIDYHPEFKVAERPSQFKKALQRAVDKNIIVQLTGIGAAGSFQLVNSFTPSPQILQGTDTAADYEDDESSSVSDVTATDSRVSRHEFNVEMFRDAYVPRPTKRHGRQAAATINRLDPSLPNPKSSTKPRKHSSGRLNDHRKNKELNKVSMATKGTGKSQGKPGEHAAKTVLNKRRKFESESEESEEEERKSKSRAALKSSGQAKKRHSSKKMSTKAAAKKGKHSEESELESESESEKVEYSPQKSRSRGGIPAVKPNAVAWKRHSSTVADTSAAKKRKLSDDSDDDNDNEEVEYTPQKSRSRGGIPVTKLMEAVRKRGSLTSPGKNMRKVKVIVSPVGSKQKHEQAGQKVVAKEIKKFKKLDKSAVKGKRKSSGAGEQSSSEHEEDSVYRARSATPSAKGSTTARTTTGQHVSYVTRQLSSDNTTTTKKGRKKGR